MTPHVYEHNKFQISIWFILKDSMWFSVTKLFLVSWMFSQGELDWLLDIHFRKFLKEHKNASFQLKLNI